MYLAPDQKKILWAFLLAFLGFTTIFIIQKNFEFMGYVVIVAILLFVMLFSNKQVKYPNFVLWGLLVWAVFHMLGGVQMPSGDVFYTLMLYPIIGEPYNILKYDQVVHAFGFFVGTLVMFTVLRKHLNASFSWKAVSVVVVMAGLGLGALNEIVEFFMTVVLPNTNVGGYENTALDLVFNFLGALIAMIFIKRYQNEFK